MTTMEASAQIKACGGISMDDLVSMVLTDYCHHHASHNWNLADITEVMKKSLEDLEHIAAENPDYALTHDQFLNIFRENYLK